MGSGLDPCAALQTQVEIPPNGAVEVVVFLGDADDDDHARTLIARYRKIHLFDVEVPEKREI